MVCVGAFGFWCAFGSGVSLGEALCCVLVVGRLGQLLVSGCLGCLRWACGVSFSFLRVHLSVSLWFLRRVFLFSVSFVKTLVSLCVIL